MTIIRNGDKKNGSQSYNTFADENDGPKGNVDTDDNAHDDKLAKLGLIALTTPGVKFFKSAQSSFQEYLMNDPDIQMSATTYGFMLTLISLPIVPLLGGALLDWKSTSGQPINLSSINAKINTDSKPSDDPDEQETIASSNSSLLNRYNSGNLVTSLRSITNSVRGSNSSELPCKNTRIALAQSYSFVGFLAVAVLGIVVYGVGLATPWVSSDLSIPVGLAGAAIFGIGEGCVMVAARAFVGHIFLGGDGAFAQGVLIAANNLSMMASKNLVPWLIERQKKQTKLQAVLGDDDNYSGQEDSTTIQVGVAACLIVQILGLLAGIMYTRLCVRDKEHNAAALAQRRQKVKDEEEQQSFLPDNEPEPYENDEGQPSFSRIKQEQLDRVHESLTDQTVCMRGAQKLTSVINLPLSFWIVSGGRAIFLVTFKVFSRYSNSFLIEKLGVGAIRAGRLSSVNEFFALFSPLVGFLAYRSPGGIAGFAIGAGFLGTISIGSLALLPADGIQGLPGGVLSPLIGISIAHGILIPICLAMIPHTVSPRQLGMAFAVVEVLGNLLNLTDIVFGWLRDLSGNYDSAMKLLCFYAIFGTVLFWISRERIGSIGMGLASRQ